MNCSERTHLRIWNRKASLLWEACTHQASRVFFQHNYFFFLMPAGMGIIHFDVSIFSHSSTKIHKSEYYVLKAGHEAI